MKYETKYYYRTPSPCDYTYGDYLNYCDDMDIPEDEIIPDKSSEFYEWCENQIYWDEEAYDAKYQFANMIHDMIGDESIEIRDIFDMYFYIKSGAVGWRRGSARSVPKRVENIIGLMDNAYEDIQMYVNIDDDGNRDYTLRMAGHDSTDYFDIVPFHEDFIVEIMDDMKDDMTIDEIVSYIGYYEFIDIKNMIAMVENIGDYDKDDMEFVINSLVDGCDREMLLGLLYGGNDE